MGEKVRPFDFVVSDEAFDYLAIQRGRISRLRHDRERWLEALKASAFADYESLRRRLPKEKPRVLDVGGGLGLIEIILDRHYGGNLDVTICDGVDDPPKMISHDRTFSHAGVAQRFMWSNGFTGTTSFCTPSALMGALGHRFDLVLSIQAWGFHFPPEPMLAHVRRLAAHQARVIVDVRLGRDWERQFQCTFWYDAMTIFQTEKSRRIAMVAP